MSKNRPFQRYEGVDEDAKGRDVPAKNNKADNSPHPVGYGRGAGEEDEEHGPGIGLNGATVDNSPRPVKRGEGESDATHGPGIGL